MSTEPELPRAGPDLYGPAYYGAGGTRPTANYRLYGPESTPHWSMPLASWLWAHCTPPFLDVGCAFGHLVRDLNRLRIKEEPEPAAQGVEWSEYATARTVGEGQVWRHDARRLPFADAWYGTVVSLDFLEHHIPADTVRCLREMDRVLQPGGWSVHLIGAHNPTEDLSRHRSDPTHLNHLALDWYLAEMRSLGWGDEPDLTIDLNQEPAWAQTDWNGRMVVFRKK